MNDWIRENWLWLAFTTGSFWALVAFFLYTPWENLKNLDKCWFNIGRRILSPAQQIVLNFVGGFAGWFCLYVFIGRVEDKSPFAVWSLLLLVIALLGISGRLSAILYSIPDAFKRYVKSKVDSSSKS